MGLIHFILTPSGLIAALFLCGSIVCYNKYAKKWCYVLIFSGMLLYLLMSIGPVSHALLHPLEHRYPRYFEGSKPVKIKYIVVLAGYAVDEDSYPISSKVNAQSLFRVVDAYMLWKNDPDRHLILTGAKKVPKIMRSLFENFGVPRRNISIDVESRSTYESAQNVGAMVKGETFILVTSAGHMPRAMAVFRKANSFPVPSPTDYLTSKNPLDANWLPNSKHLNISDLAIHEYFGMLYYRLRGKI